MANWTKKRVLPSQVNNGQKFRPIDGVTADDINNIFESALYTQDVVENISASATSGTQANVNVNYDSQGHIILDFTLPKGDKGDKGDPGSGAETLEPLVNENLYNLGAYDTISGNTITRQTGYVNGFKTSDFGSLNNANNLKFYTYFLGKNTQFISNLEALGYSVSPSIWVETTYGKKYQYNATDGYLSFMFTGANVDSDIANIIIQYELETSYTEELIENQPLNTLDQQGSQWLRKEWEKGLNLFTCPKYNGTTNNITYSIENGVITLNGTANANTYIDLNVDLNVVNPSTLFFSNQGTKTSGNIGFYLYNTLGTWLFDTWNFNANTSNYTGNISKMRIYIASGITLTNYQIKPMLNYGSHAYPYQPYNGGIVHQDDITPKLLWENPNPNIIEYPNTTLNNMGALLNYKYLIFEYKDSSNDATTYFQKVKIAKTGISTILIYNANAVNTTFYSREVYFDASDNSLEFDTCYISTADSTNNVSNAYIIPIAIYGTNLL